MSETNLVTLRAEYEDRKSWVDRTIAVLNISTHDADLLRRQLERERDTAQALISGVQRWNEERNARALCLLASDLTTEVLR